MVPLATPALFWEYEEVLKRPEQRAVSAMTLSQVDGVLAALAAAIEPVEVSFVWRPQLADSDDEMDLVARFRSLDPMTVVGNRPLALCFQWPACLRNSHEGVRISEAGH